MILAVTNGKIWTGDRFIDGSVVAEDGIIECVGEDSDGLIGQADRVFDASGGIVCPGLVDIHIHMRHISDGIYGVSAELACVPFGVTAAAEAAACFFKKEVADSVIVKNKVFVCTEIKNNTVDFTPTELLLDEYGDRVIGLKVFFSSSKHTLDTKPLKKVCSYARAKGLKVLVHCTSSPSPFAEIVDCLSAGDIITHAFHGAPNSCDADDFEAIKNAQAKGVIIDVGMAGGVHCDFSIAKKALDNGVLPNTVSSDIVKRSAYWRGGRYGLTACMSIMRALGMSEAAVLKAVTSSAAEAIGLGDVCGRLAVGRPADIAVLKNRDGAIDVTDSWGNRLNVSNGYRCILTVADGEIVYGD